MSVNQKVIIYQLVVRYFGNVNQTNQWSGDLATNGCGKFADVTETALQSLKRLGVTHLWLTGCLRQATLTGYPELDLPADDPDIVKGLAGSFYSVRDYFDVCPDYAINPAARLDEFQALIERSHQAGLKILMDFVPNHVARSYHSVVRPDLDFGTGDDQTTFYSRDNSFFYLVDSPGQGLRLAHPAGWEPEGLQFDGHFAPENGTVGRIPKATANAWKFGTTLTPSETDWYEAIKLNYGFNYVTEAGDYEPTPRTWAIMDQILGWWQAKGVDGFRCDMAHLIPKEAWSYLIGLARDSARDPGAYFLAEAYVGTSPFDPVKTVPELLDVGFDAVYHDNSYNRLTELYRGGTQEGYDAEMTSLSNRERGGAVEYLENHDKPRAAAPIAKSGFGSFAVNYQLAPLQFLYSSGPVLLLNGQETGEPGHDAEGFGGDDGRTTFFDYWCMPEFAKWVNGHAFDGGRLSPDRKRLRNYFADLLSLCQDESVRSDQYWGLKYFNRSSVFADCPDDLYSFGRFEANSGRLLVVVINFGVGRAMEGRIRIPQQLSAAACLTEDLSLQLILNCEGKQNSRPLSMTRASLVTDGFQASLLNLECQVFAIQ